MYKNPHEAVAFFEHFIPNLNGGVPHEVVVFPPSIAIPAAVASANGSSVQIGGQNIFWAPEGAYTGEISGEMLCSAGASWVLIGHSERPQYFHETDADVLKKTVAALEAGLRPIICIGERLEEHKAGKTSEILIRQFAGGLAGLTEEQFSEVAIAYEPIWAIGTGQTAT